MNRLRRIYDTIFQYHFENYRQMIWVVGSRQVGKTNACSSITDNYLNWDNLDDRAKFVAGPSALAESIGLLLLREKTPTVVFDELHKWGQWQTLLKGFFDSYGDKVKLFVTGSSRLDVYRKGGDSLMGRYLLYRMYPLSVAELITTVLPDTETVIRKPCAINEDDFMALYDHGGFPEPFVRRSMPFTRRWRTLRTHQLLKEDIRETTRIQELGQIEMLASLLMLRSGSMVTFADLAKEIRVAADTVRRWVETLVGFHYGFLIRPWYRNIANSLRKEPKWFVLDWSVLKDPGARIETMVACHLKKAVDGWTDLGLGDFELCYLRDKQKREVDFLVTRDNEPWFLVEVKKSDCSITPALHYFHEQTKAPFAFQAVFDLPYVDADCFASPKTGPLVVPVKTLLSQLF